MHAFFSITLKVQERAFLLYILGSGADFWPVSLFFFVSREGFKKNQNLIGIFQLGWVGPPRNHFPIKKKKYKKNLALK